MIILEVLDGATKFIDDDGNYNVSYDEIAEIFPLELGPHFCWDELSRIEDWEECPF